MHGDDDRGIGVVGSDDLGRPAPHREVVRHLNLLEGAVAANQVSGKGAGTSFAGEARPGITLGPGVVMPGDRHEDLGPRFRRFEFVIAPMRGEPTGQAGMIAMLHQGPAAACLNADHKSASARDMPAQDPAVESGAPANRLAPRRPGWQRSCSYLRMTTALDNLLNELRGLLGPENVISQGDSLETLSKDYYWYSPVLRRQLEDKRADLIVRPGTLEQTRAAVAACCRARVAVVPRGAGTGNYGQSVPLFGGAVVDLSRLDRILSLDGGVARVEPGARLGTIEASARAVGWQLRCMPSTWMKSTMAGFICGGSGGIGSITWGGINAPGTMKSVTLLTCEESPRLIRLEEEETLKALHTYGTTGVMVELEMRLAPKVDYDQLIFSSPDWGRLLDWTDAAARRAAWGKRLVTQFEWPIPSYFKPLQRSLRPEEPVTFLLLDRSQTDDAVREAEAAGLACVYRRPLTDPPKPPFITDFTWNHTTLWAIKCDPAITYLQSGFGRNFREQFAELHRRFPGEILFHLEWTAGNSKMLRGNAAALNPDPVVVGGIPLVRFRSEERLAEILRCCEEIGVFIANPHTFYLEEGGRHPNIADKRALKSEVDPHGLLNPGNMKTYPHNTFVSAAVSA